MDSELKLSIGSGFPYVYKPLIISL